MIALTQDVSSSIPTGKRLARIDGDERRVFSSANCGTIIPTVAVTKDASSAVPIEERLASSRVTKDTSVVSFVKWCDWRLAVM